ncbi:hypothetical protein [uncultured Hoeflea sp.]|uniref:hypothetical protein n=1 Tax=uncultured Hoeflea sp. TaxID=538666 RepID=UPI0026162AE1|nr:hypothetical protein [uncultured Hoeflea sp.]
MVRFGVARLTAALTVAMMTGGAAMAQDPGPRIDDIVWPGIDSYCSFMRADHEFDFNDPESWRWVLFTNFPSNDVDDPIEAPFMRINGQLKQLVQTGVSDIEGGVERSYASHDAEPYTVTLTMLDGDEGYESAAYSGVITVTRGGASSEIAYKGDCGV